MILYDDARRVVSTTILSSTDEGVPVVRLHSYKHTVSLAYPLLNHILTTY